MEIQDEDLEESLAWKKRIREEGKEAFDRSYSVRYILLQVNDVVLQYDKVVADIDKLL